MANQTFTGTVERLFVNDRIVGGKEKKSISIANNKVYYGLGLHDVGIYKVDGVVLKEGMEVTFQYTDGKYKNVVDGTLKILSAPPKATNDKDLAIRLGNAVTVSTNLTNDVTQIVSTAKQVLPLIDALRDKLANKHTDMTDYSLGARLGQCVVVASEFTKDVNKFIGVAERLFEEICKAESELKSGSSVEPQSKPSAPQQSVNVSVKQEPITSANNLPEPPMDFDDSIPF